MRKALIALLIAIPLAAALLLFKPWSEHNVMGLFLLFEPDQRISNFQNMETLYPTRTVKAGSQVFQFKKAESDTTLPPSFEFQSQAVASADFLQRSVTTGLMVIQNDRILHEDYFHGAHEHTRFTSWSVAKSFVATLVGIALKEGKIASLDHAIDRYVPELRGSAYEGVPIEHVLQMSSGVDFDETYSAQFSDIQLFFWQVYGLGRSADSVMSDYQSAKPSGQEMHYASVDTQALGMLLKRVYQQNLSSLLQEKLWQPLGMERDAIWAVDGYDENAMEIAFCCLSVTVRDYAKLGRLYLNQGQWQGNNLLPENWVPQATRPGSPHLEPGASPHDYGPRGYQYQWWMPADYEDEYMAVGIWGQYIYVSEPDNLIIVKTSVDPDFTPNVAENIAFFRGVRNHLRTTAERKR